MVASTVASAATSLTVTTTRICASIEDLLNPGQWCLLITLGSLCGPIFKGIDQIIGEQSASYTIVSA